MRKSISLAGIVCLFATVARANLLFSEYVEGSALNKALEVYNNGPGNVEQNQVTIELYFDGNSFVGSTTTLTTGTLAVGDVWVVAYTLADAALLAKADETSANITYNGNDTAVLKLNGVVQDCIGQVGFNPGQKWSFNGVETIEQTLVRKNTTADTNTGDAYDPSDYFNPGTQDDFSDTGIATVPIRLSQFELR